jgi:hypothetical protein
MEAIHSVFSSRRFNRILFWGGAAMLVAGVVVLMLKLIPSSSGDSGAPDKGFKAQLPAKTAPLTNAQGVKVTRYDQLNPDIRLAIRKFIVDAVAGKNYAESWKYIAPSFRSGYTFKQWVHANAHPFVPYPVYKFDESKFGITEATTKEILVDLKVAAKPSSGIRPTRFRIGLNPVGKEPGRKWLVTYWMPLWTPALPSGQ